MHFLTQTLLTLPLLLLLLITPTLSIPNPQGVPPQGGGGGDQGTCHWTCCEYDDLTAGTLCVSNPAPYPHGVDCDVDLEYAANMTCCRVEDCSDQTVMPAPVRVV
ncbi:hypothetical protein MFRU_043g00420 [Monilinia fructicola]|nr:hypothetical protein MFRU_043g00420 [Monilinia fructicola]